MSRRQPQLTPEQMVEFERMRAESRTPKALAEEARERELIMEEFPPVTMPVEAVEAMANLRLARERKGLSLGDVSERTGIDRTALSKMERGRGNPTFATIGRVTAAIGLKMVVSFADAE
jgi:ribosome-binding protein aMBF1 (putative translation factor)